jgi:CrcB protein
MPYLWVFIGGGLGSICRYGIARLIFPLQTVFPLATLAANALSCILLGFLMAWDRQGLIPPPHKLLLLTGFCGGFSTFSTFTGETYGLFETGHWSMAFLNIAGSFLLCLFCLFLGTRLALVIPNQ